MVLQKFLPRQRWLWLATVLLPFITGVCHLNRKAMLQVS